MIKVPTNVRAMINRKVEIIRRWFFLETCRSMLFPMLVNHRLSRNDFAVSQMKTIRAVKVSAPNAKRGAE